MAFPVTIVHDLILVFSLPLCFLFPLFLLKESQKWKGYYSREESEHMCFIVLSLFAFLFLKLSSTSLHKVS
jgi:hypothetical protein